MRLPNAILSITLAGVAASCQPDVKCSGELYYDGQSCRKCPKDAKFKDGTCLCNDSDYYEFANNKCSLLDGAMPPVEETPDAGMSASGSCSTYCDFQKLCIADNGIASSVLSDIVKGLKADDPKACKSACESDTGGNGTMDPIVACFEAGRAAAACEHDATQVGLGGAIKLMGMCCKGKSAALCKSICGALTANSILKSMIDFCN